MATLYFNAAVDDNWNNLSNWWMDDQFTTQATSLPSSIDNVVLTETCESNTGSIPTVNNLTISDNTNTHKYIAIEIIVNGVATFNNNSANLGTITGNALFNDESFNGYYATINGNVIFNDSSRNNLDSNINGDATFNDSAYNSGAVSGDATFNDSSYNYGTITGNVIFNDSASNYIGTVTGNATFNDSSYNAGDVNGNITYNGFTGWKSEFNIYFIKGQQTNLPANGTGFFNDAYYANGVMLFTPNMYFNNAVDSDYQTLGNWWLNSDCTIPATNLPSSSDNIRIIGSVSSQGLEINSGSVPTVQNVIVKGPVANLYISIEMNVTNLAVFDGSNAYLYTDLPENGYAIINGNCLFVNGASVYYEDNIDDAVVNGNAIFNDDSYNYGTVSGNATFNDSSYNNYYSTVTGNATFNGVAYNDGTVTGDAIFNDSSYNNYGTVTGDATFNDSASNNYGTVTGNATFNGVAYNADTVTGNATFNDSSYNNGVVDGNATFNDSSYNNGVVDGNATFNDSSRNTSTVTGNATFSGSSYNLGAASGDATFNENSHNNGTVTGNATFNGASYTAVDATIGTLVLGTRTPSPLRFGINNSNILGMI